MSSPQSVGGPRAGETGGGSSGSPRCVRIFRIGPGSASRCLPTLPFRQRRDGPPQLVVRRKHPWLVSRRQAMPMLPGRGHEIGEPVEELKRRELDDAIGPRTRGLSAAAGPDPSPRGR